MGRNLIKLCSCAHVCVCAPPQTSPQGCNLICRKEQAVSHDWFKGAPAQSRARDSDEHMRTCTRARPDKERPAEV